MPWHARRVAALLVAALLLSCGGNDQSDTSGNTLQPAARSTVAESVSSSTRSHPGGTIIAAIRRSGRPFGVAVSRTGIVYCTLLDSAQLVRIAVRADSVGTVPVAAVPTDVAFSPAGTWAYVTNQRARSIGIVDAQTNTQVGLVPVEGDPFRVVVGPEGQQVYVTTNLGTLVQIDAGTRKVTWTKALGGNLNGLAINTQGTRIYVGDVGGTVYELDPTGDVLRSMALPGRPQGLALSSDGRELYAAGEAGDFIVIDLASATEVARTPLGAGGFGIAITPDQVHIWVTAPAAGRVFVLDRVSRTLAATITLGGVPRRLSFDWSGSTAVVADEGGTIRLLR